MSQKNIKNYFSKKTATNKDANISSDSDSSTESIDIQPSGDLAYYNDLFKRQAQLKKMAKVVVSEGGLSECWRYFGDLYLKKKKILENLKFCKVCFEEEPMVLKGFATSTATTNYNKHLRLVHQIEAKSLNFKKNSVMTKNALDPKSTKNDKFQNARRLAEMCCIDLQPFTIVERQGFQKYSKFLNPSTTFPRAYTIASSALNDVYELYLSHIKNILDNSPQHVCLVLDMWSDKYKHLSYINFKIHFCKNFKLMVITLKTEIFSRPHTGIAVSQKIKEVIDEFNLTEKNISAVTDGGTNIVSALKMNSITRFGCIAHALHRFLSHDVLNHSSFTHLNEIIGKLKKIYRSLMYSTEEIWKLQKLKEQDDLAKILLESQKLVESFDSDEQFPSGDDDFSNKFKNAMNDNYHTSLKNSVPTRWSSLLVMLDSFTKNIDIINIALLKVKQDPLLIPEMEKQIIIEFKNYLQIFDNATKYLQGQKYSTISACIYFYESIIKALETAGENSCFALTIQLCDFSIEHFSRRFQIMKIHLIAALLDPCQKNWTLLEKYLKRIPKYEFSPNSYVLNKDADNFISKEQLLYDEIKKIDTVGEDGPSTSNASLESIRKKQKITDTRQQMLEFMSNASLDENIDLLKKEIKKYFAIEVSGTENIDWWIQNKEIFPNIAKLANVCFGIPATSASSEQAFSVAGSCINGKRSQLNPTTVKKQLFIHDNNKVVEPFL